MCVYGEVNRGEASAAGGGLKRAKRGERLSAHLAIERNPLERVLRVLDGLELVRAIWIGRGPSER
jgi:hypothetical protein